MSENSEAIIVTLGATAALTLALTAMDYRDAIKHYNTKIQEIDSNPQLLLLEKDYPKRPTYFGVLKGRFAEITGMTWR